MVMGLRFVCIGACIVVFGAGPLVRVRPVVPRHGRQRKGGRWLVDLGHAGRYQSAAKP